MDISELVEPLKRTVASPGEFATFFPNTLDTDLNGVLVDGAAESQLDGFLPGKVFDLDATPQTITTDPNSLERALIVLYAASRIVSARTANLKSRTRYKAGNVEAETEQAATVLNELLRGINLRKKQFIDDLRSGYLSNGPDGLQANVGTAISTFGMADLYTIRAFHSWDGC